MGDDVGMSNITVEIADHIAVVTLDRPPVNAVDRAFMAGVDLRSVNEPLVDPPASQQLDPPRAARDAMWSITDCAVPVIGAINGPALGAGIAFAACCDILLASDNATFGTTEINVGLLGASSHLSLLVGRHKAREMFFTGE